MLILASTSPTRKALMEKAGLVFDVVPAVLDERAVEAEALSQGADPGDLALLLARAKADAVSALYPDALVIGADQTLSLGTEFLHKPADREDAARQLDHLAGKTHRLRAAVALVQGRQVRWSDVQTAELTMRDFDAAERDLVLDLEGEAALTSVGGYRLEGPSIRLFETVAGDYFTILGLPLLPLIAALRDIAPHRLLPGPGAHVTIKAFVIGHPIAHSRSPLIHGTWLAEHAIDGRYDAIDVAPDALPSFFERLRRGEFAGGNVTIPHKEAVFALCDSVDELARKIGAVNTLVVRDGKVHGYNTDYLGFLGNLDAAAPGWSDGPNDALIIGAGGAARAVLVALRRRDGGKVHVLNRTLANAQALVSEIDGPFEAHGFEAFPALASHIGLVVNTSSIGMHGTSFDWLDLALLPKTTLVTDIVYTPLITPLLASAQAHGLKTVDGLGMLLHQAAPGFADWFGVTPTVTPALRARVEATLGH